MIAFVIPFAGESSEASCEMNSNDASLDTALQNQVAEDKTGGGYPDNFVEALQPSDFLH